jgi:hypothetical protein
VRTSWLIARSFDRHTFIFWTDEGTTVDALETPENSFTLGGFLNLSGLTPGFLSGRTMASADSSITAGSVAAAPACSICLRTRVSRWRPATPGSIARICSATCAEWQRVLRARYAARTGVPAAGYDEAATRRSTCSWAAPSDFYLSTFSNSKLGWSPGRKYT